MATTTIERDAGPAGAGLLGQLRGDAARRALVDPGLAGGLRAWLEDGVVELCRAAPGSLPVRVTARSVRRLAGGAGGGSPTSGNRPIGALARAALVRALFRQLVTTGRLGDPMHEGLDALGVEPEQADLVARIAGLRSEQRAALAEEVAAHAAVLRRHWSLVPDQWLPRCADRLTIPLGGGRVVLSGVVDLLIGRPCADRASVCLVLVRAGPARPEDRAELLFAALLETLRSGAPPFRAALHYSGTGETLIVDVTEQELARAVQRTVDALGCDPAVEPTAGVLDQ
ncbi:MAG TPA: hypothetical protein VGL60_10415 [Acidimicrobiales bacterium]|jgi:hypothetical protein